jgi:hypothetical protein
VILPLDFVKGAWVVGLPPDTMPVNEIVLPIVWVALAGAGLVAVFQRRRA